MNATTFKLAQINISRIKSEGIDSPEMQSLNFKTTCSVLVEGTI